MRGDLTLTILQLIQGAGKITTEVLDTLTYFGYVETYRRMKGLKSLIPERKPILEKTIKNLKERQKISKLLYKLSREGLIYKRKESKDVLWKITEKGLNKIRVFNKNVKPIYKIALSNELKLIIFDIPEIRRRDRNWLRHVLNNLKFKMLQKSVWAGKTMLPEEFFNDLRDKNLLSYIEILAITKSGTIKQLT
ncbi:MAG: hypothetical protein Q8P76_03195 [bacterium]|nr:hypothetical protein [bacterium]